jgi:hypothetical protein
MIIKKILQSIILFSFLNIGCESQKNILCDDDLKVDNIYSIIDTTKIYSTFYMKDNIEVENYNYLQFKNNGKIIYYGKTSYNDSIVRVSPKYLRGEYYIKDNRIILNEYFRHVQGGGWIKSTLKNKKNDVLYIRVNKSCKLNSLLREIKLEDKNKIEK